MAEQHGTNDLEELTAAAPARAIPLAMIAKGMAFPVFFVVMFALCYVSAFHNPVPHNVQLALVGPAQQTSMIADQIAQSSPGAFEITATTDRAGALEDLGAQRVAGVIELGPTVTAHIASGGGITVAQAVEHVAQPLADGLGTTVTVQDAAPLGAGDSTGMGLFYFMIVCTIGGYITVMVLSQVAVGMTLRRQVGILGAMSAGLPLLAYAVSSIFVGAYGASAAGLVALLLIGMAYTFAVGLVSLGLNKLAGQSAIFLIMTFAIFLNFPSAGGAIPASFLPGFWNGMHSFWVGSGAMQSMRSVIFFGGSGLGTGLLILGGWIVVGALLLLALDQRGRRRVTAAAEQPGELVAAR
ncbi:hypothetical protein [Tomitella biformata]|uniref:hypothetical protein n=1 Tax=Tomitella biformata TaxID=630403 RepID=UPI0019081F2B|nr:hypothetical protein [Tomitella biformata]